MLSFSRSSSNLLFPVNMGERGKPNGNGEAFIALALSCDGQHWSELIPLVWSVGIDGRTTDQPVDGLLGAHFLISRDIYGVAVAGGSRQRNASRPDPPRLVRYELRMDALRECASGSSIVACAGTTVRHLA